MSGMRSYVSRLAVPTATGSTLNVLDTLGITHAEKVYDQRIKALTKPQDYKDDRDKQLVKLKLAVGNVYADTMNDMLNTGLPYEAKQQLALHAAASSYQTQNAILESNFPSGSTAIAEQSFANKSFPGMLSTPSISQRAPRRAPVRRTKASKKKK